MFGIILNVAAGIGAFLFGFLDDYFGGKKTIQLTNLGFIIACTIAIIAPSIEPANLFGVHITGKLLFWISGALIGIFMGPNQSASRSLMGRLIPDDKTNEYYGFFAFSGKATAFIGPLLFSSIVSITNDLRYGLSIVVILFIIGFLLLSRVDEKAAIDNVK